MHIVMHIITIYTWYCYALQLPINVDEGWTCLWSSKIYCIRIAGLRSWRLAVPFFTSGCNIIVRMIVHLRRNRRECIIVLVYARSSSCAPRLPASTTRELSLQLWIIIPSVRTCVRLVWRALCPSTCVWHLAVVLWNVYLTNIILPVWECHRSQVRTECAVIRCAIFNYVTLQLSCSRDNVQMLVCVFSCTVRPNPMRCVRMEYTSGYPVPIHLDIRWRFAVCGVLSAACVRKQKEWFAFASRHSPFLVFRAHRHESFCEGTFATAAWWRVSLAVCS